MNFFNSTIISLRLCNPEDFDPLNGLHNPQPVQIFEIFEQNYFYNHYKKDSVIRPFLQSYQYLVISHHASEDGHIIDVSIIPYCERSKKQFYEQYDVLLKSRKEEFSELKLILNNAKSTFSENN